MIAAKLLNEPPISERFSTERAFGHAVACDEGLDFGQDGLLRHGQQISRVITRTSIPDAGDYTKLREYTRAPIIMAMAGNSIIDVEKLKADMAAEVERTSGRNFSLKATGGKNPDWYRNLTKNGQDKRLSADVFMGAVVALGRSPRDYVIGLDVPTDTPNATILTSTFSMLLASVGIDPLEGGRAQKLAAQFPGALTQIVNLHAQTAADLEQLPDEGTPADDTDQPQA